MRSTKALVLLAGLVLVLAACGRAPSSGANQSPSPSATAAESPTAQPTPLTIPEPLLHGGEVALAYTAVSYSAQGGSAPYIWMVSAGTLPNGLSISPEGAISGMPTAAGSFAFTVQVTDAAMATAYVGGQITIAPRLMYHYLGGMASHGEMEICLYGGRPSCAPSNTDDRYASFAAISGGAGPYTYRLVSGTLPPETHLNGLALAGTYTDVRQAFNFTVRVTDSLGATVDIPAAYNVYFTTAGDPTP